MNIKPGLSPEPTPQNSIMFWIFRSLQYRDFRVLWCGLLISAIGTWMQIIAISLLVLKITHGSAFALGCVSLTQASSFFLFALMGGSVADRVDKRRLLLLTQSTSALLAVLLGLLTYADLIRFWMILAVSFLNGAVLSVDQPARGALIAEMVPHEDLMNALSLQANLFTAASAFGPALAGLSVSLLGYSANFFFNAVSFTAVLAALYLIRTTHPIKDGRQPIPGPICESLNTVRHDPVLPWVLSTYAVLLCFSPSPALMLPVFAVSVLHATPEHLGFLFSSIGIGSIVGAILLAAHGTDARKGQLHIAGVLLSSVALAGFALSRHLQYSVAALLVLGIGQSVAATSAITLLQMRVSAAMRGRAMSLNTLLVMGLRPLGDFPLGALMSTLGAPEAVLLSAFLIGAYGSAVEFFRPPIHSA
jgi:MFS family permease